ncbi:hypothetical protein [Paenibacillus agilis]|uniref:Uncharacterized protein n=1 Tax=Paenibacillus agilis TaxID=3020863 RepID=A0A559IE88_9BACL|nr:hypothetical protein [Paenibacillus agilis]TVX85977.1 hypothetical protein FPZ44_23800 [Paenibacillus agilis]
MTKKERTEMLRVERSKLLREINEALPEFRATKISNIESRRIFIEGGIFPASYDRDEKKLYIWGRSSRSSGGVMSVEELIKLENAFRLWDAETVIEDAN